MSLTSRPSEHLVQLVLRIKVLITGRRSRLLIFSWRAPRAPDTSPNGLSVVAVTFDRDDEHKPVKPGYGTSWYKFSEVGRIGPDLPSAVVADATRQLRRSGAHQFERCRKARAHPRLPGHDTISDLATSLIKHYLFRYTSDFVIAHLPATARTKMSVPRATFN